MTKHTPGPWHLSGNSAWADSCKDRGNVFSCELHTGTHVPPDQNEANARLISAAPELLEALKAMRAAFDPYDPSIKEAEACDAADAAIAKAEGGAA